MNPILGKLFGKAGKTLVDAVGNTLDNLITNKEELAAAKLAIEQEAHRHLEQLESNAIKEIELHNSDKASARTREMEVTKSLGHIDYITYFLCVSGIVVFFFIVWHLTKENLPNDNRELLYHTIGIIEGIIISIYSYYFGSSAGSRVKDMRKS